MTGANFRYLCAGIFGVVSCLGTTPAAFQTAISLAADTRAADPSSDARSDDDSSNADSSISGNGLTVRQTRSVHQLPARLKTVSTQADWGMGQPCEITLELLNRTGNTWFNVSADGGCSCLNVQLDKPSPAGIAPGRPLKARLAYARPKDPGMTPRTLTLRIDGAEATLPVLIDWQSPVLLKQVTPIGDATWLLSGQCRDPWSIDWIDVPDRDLQIVSRTIRENEFEVRLSATLQITRTVRLLFHVSSATAEAEQGDDASFEQLVQARLESDRVRSVPTMLICRIDEEGRFLGDTRLVFPRARRGARPRITHCDLLAASGAAIPLAFRQSDLGRIAIRVHFDSDVAIAKQTIAESSKVRFSFDDGSQLDCRFLVSKGQ